MRDDQNDPHNKSDASSGDLLSELGSIKQLLDDELSQDRVVPAKSIKEIGSVEEYLQLKQAADSAGLSIEAYLAHQAEALRQEGLELVEEDDDDIPMLDEIVTLDVIEEEGAVEDEANGGDSLLQELADKEEHTPTTAEATTVEEYFAAVAAAKRQQYAGQTPASSPQPHSATAFAAETHNNEIPLLDEVVEQESAIPTLEDVIEHEPSIPMLDEVVAEDDVPLLDEIASEERATSGDEGVTLDEMQELVDLIVHRKLQHLKPELEKEVMAELQKLLPSSALHNS